MNKSTITQLWFVETGKYHRMGVRPLSAYLGGIGLDDLESRTNGFTNVSTGDLAGLAGQILRPSTDPKGEVPIENGWGEQRFAFIMRVETPGEDYYQDASVRVDYVNGYTNFPGDRTLQSGLLDPNMRMYINTVISTREIVSNNWRRSNLVSADRFLQAHTGMEDSAYALRPRDVAVAVGNIGFGLRVDSDFRGSLSVRPMFSAIRNELPSDYMSRLIRGYQRVVNAPTDFGEERDLPTLMSEVAGATGDEAGINNRFVMGLHRNTRLYDGSFFTLSELEALYPEVKRDEVTTVITFHDPRRQINGVSEARSQGMDIGFGLADPSNVSEWSGSDHETIMASIVASEVPALMMDAMLTQCSFTISNDTFNGQPAFQWFSAPASFMSVGVDLTPMIKYFEGRLIGEVFSDLTQRGQIIVSLSVFSDLISNDSYARISVDGGPAVDFCIPNFASSIITPMLGNNKLQVESLAGAMEGMFNMMQPEGQPLYDASQGATPIASDPQPIQGSAAWQL